MYFTFFSIISHSPAMAGVWDRISMFWGERKIVEKTYLQLKLLSPNGTRAFSKPLSIGLEMGWDPRILGGTKERKRQQFSTFSHWVFSILKYITKVKLLFLYIFYVLYVLFHYKPLSGDGGRVRPHFYVLRWTENCRRDIFAFEATLTERGARESALYWI